MAHISDWRVRETTTTEGTSDLTLAGAMRGSLPFSSVMSTNDTCDYVVHYDTVFEAGFGTMGSDGKLQRTTVYRARHANGDINTTKVSLPPGVKTVITAARAEKITRVDLEQTFTQTERDQHCANLGLPQSGDKAICPQATAWVGWTKDTSQHDAAIRIVTDSNGGATGGSVDFSTLHARTATDSVTLAQANLPNVTLSTSISSGQGSHSHLSGASTNFYAFGGSSYITLSGVATAAPYLLTGTGATTLPSMSGTTPLGGSGTSFAPAIDMRVKYMNAIICTKD